MIGQTNPTDSNQGVTMRAAATMVAIAWLTTACTRSSCDNQAYYGLPSPDGRYIAFIFHRRCAGPQGVSTQVSLMPFHDSLRGDPGYVLAVAGEQPVMVSWRGPRTLSVTGFETASFRREGPLDGIGIEFHPSSTGSLAGGAD